MTAKGYRELPHTADVAIEAWGKDLPELLVHAAQGLFGLAALVEPGAQPSIWRHLDLTAPDVETLLVDWLNELLLLYDENGEVYVTFQVSLPAPSELHAEVGGTKAFAALRAVKAATFHNLAVRQDVKGYHATVVFDI